MKPDVAAYYNQTQNHYQRWWQLDRSMALHYGIWFEDTTNFAEALHNTNSYLANLVEIQYGQKVLDAGCGVGGAAIFLAKNYNCRVTGITLSELQVETAKQNASKHNVNNNTNFKQLDYSDTKLAANTYDVIWACESSSSAINKQKMADEWFRLLKPGGKLVLSDFFKAQNEQEDNDQLLDKWVAIWAMGPLVTNDSLSSTLTNSGFKINQNINLTPNIIKTVRRMYKSYWLGLIPSVVYNIFFAARPYALNHYKSGLYQYKALMQNLWQYKTILAIKPAN